MSPLLKIQLKICLLGQSSKENKWVWLTERDGEFGEEDSLMMMQFLHNSYPLNQTYSKEDGFHDCEVGLLHKIEKRNNSNEDLKQLQVWS